MNRRRRGVTTGIWLAGLLAAAAIAPGGAGQDLDERLDEQRFLDALTDLQLPELLEHYLATHPAEEPVRAALHGITAQRMTLRRPGSTIEQRRAATERILEIRQSLLAARPGDLRRARWLAEQAGDIYFELLPLEGTDLVALFGVLPPAQRESTGRAVSMMRRRAEEAAVAVQESLLRLEGAAGEDPSPERRQELRRLADRERDRRIPFLRGVAATLHADLNEPEADRRRAHYELACDLLPRAADRLDGPVAAQARLYAGLALTGLGRYADARAQLDAAAASGAARTGFAAALGQVRLTMAHKGPEAALRRLAALRSRYRGPDEIFQRVLLADMRYRLHRQRADQAGRAARRAALDEAYSSYGDLLHEEPQENAAAIRSVVLQRIQATDTDGLPLASLPPIVSIARAEQLAGEAEHLPEAIASLQDVLQRPDLPATEAAMARFILGGALHEDGRPDAAIQPLLELARDHPADPQAGRAIEVAATLAVREHQSRPEDAARRQVLGEVLEVLLEQHPDVPAIDRWRYQAGRLAIEEGRFDAARARLAEVTAGSASWCDAQFMIVSAWRSQWSSLPVGEPRRQAGLQVADEGRRVRGLLDHRIDSGVAGERRRELIRYGGFLRVFQAEVELDNGRLEAVLQTLDGIESQSAQDGAVIAAALRLRIDALQGLGRLADAQVGVSRFIAAEPDRAEQVLLPMMAAVQQEVEQLLERGREEEALAAAQSELAPLAQMLRTWMTGADRSPRQPQQLRRRLADAYRLAGRFDEALAQYEMLLAIDPNVLPYLLGRAECLFGLDGSEEDMGQAMRIYRRIAALGVDEVGPAYWQAQLRQLQILDRVGRNTQKIAPRIQRLRQEDPDLGGDRFRRAFDELQRRKSD